MGAFFRSLLDPPPWLPATNRRRAPHPSKGSPEPRYVVNGIFAEFPAGRKRFYNSPHRFPTGRKWGGELGAKGDRTSESPAPPDERVGCGFCGQVIVPRRVDLFWRLAHQSELSSAMHGHQSHQNHRATLALRQPALCEHRAKSHTGMQYLRSCALPGRQ
jgi:hypothetical protein